MLTSYIHVLVATCTSTCMYMYIQLGTATSCAREHLYLASICGLHCCHCCVASRSWTPHSSTRLSYQSDDSTSTDSDYWTSFVENRRRVHPWESGLYSLLWHGSHRHYTHSLFLSLSLSCRLLSETNERRFDSRQVIASPRKRVKKHTEKSHLYDFPKPIWAKNKKVLYTPGSEKTIKEEE